MKEAQILSVFHYPATASGKNAAPAPLALVFGACHVGVVLRAVLFVQAQFPSAVKGGVFQDRIEEPA